MTTRVKLSINVIIHATESEDVVVEALEKTMCASAKSFKRTKVAGHFGNEIVMLNASVTGRAAKSVLSTLRKTLGWKTRAQIIAEISKYIFDGVLHIRLDKQELVRGRITCMRNGTIRMRVSTPVYGKQDAHCVYADLFAE